MKEIRFKLKTGKIVLVSVTDDLLCELKQGKKLTKNNLYDGPVLFGVISEYCAFDGTQVERIID